MSINQLFTKSFFILLVLASLHSAQAQNEYSTEQQATQFDNIMNIVEPSEIAGTEVLIKDLELSDDELSFH